MNAAVWFGAALFFTLGLGTAPFSQDMKTLLGDKYFPYFSGAIAQIFIARYFRLHVVCGLIALAHFVAERVYFGRASQRLWVTLLIGLVAAGLFGAYGLQPKMKRLHAIKYDVKAPQAVRDSAAQSFRAWHGVSQGVNLLMLGGLALYLWGVAHPSDPARFLTAAKFRS